MWNRECTEALITFELEQIQTDRFFANDLPGLCVCAGLKITLGGISKYNYGGENLDRVNAAQKHITSIIMRDGRRS